MANLTKEQQIEQLRAEVERLTTALSDAEKAATADSEAALRAKFIGNDHEELPTGKSVKVTSLKVMKIVGYTNEGIPMREPVWEEIEVPTFMYRIDMPAIGGDSIRINGQDYYHGQTYTVDLHTLRSLKEIVYRLRAHEATVFGSNENAYRKKTAAVFSGKVGGRVH